MNPVQWPYSGSGRDNAPMLWAPDPRVMPTYMKPYSTYNSDTGKSSTSLCKSPTSLKNCFQQASFRYETSTNSDNEPTYLLDKYPQEFDTVQRPLCFAPFSLCFQPFPLCFTLPPLIRSSPLLYSSLLGVGYLRHSTVCGLVGGCTPLRMPSTLTKKSTSSSSLLRCGLESDALVCAAA